MNSRRQSAAQHEPRIFIATSALLLSLLAPSTPAQDSATTLAELCARSDAVVLTTTNGMLAGTNGGQRHAVQFAVTAVLAGSAPARFTLEEPAGRSCGRALCGITPGAYVLFLDEIDGRPRLTVPTARAVAPAEAALLAHVRALLTAGTGERARLSVLIAGLSSAAARVRNDAALALPRQRQLELASTADREQIVAALAAALPQRDGAAVGLLQTAERLRLANALDVVLEPYLAGEHEHAERMLCRVIPALGAATVAQHIAANLPTEPRARERAVRVLEPLPAAIADEPLRRIFLGGEDAAAIHAGAALLAHGTSAEWLRARCSADLLTDILAGAAPRRPVFRNVSRRRSP